MPFIARSKKKPIGLRGGSIVGGCATCAGGGCPSCPTCMSGGGCGCLNCAIKDYAEAKGGGGRPPKGCVKIKAKRKPSLRGCVKKKRKVSTKPRPRSALVPVMPVMPAVPVMPSVPVVPVVPVVPRYSAPAPDVVIPIRPRAPPPMPIARAYPVPIAAPLPPPAILPPMPAASDSKRVPVAAPLPPPRAARRPARAQAPRPRSARPIPAFSLPPPPGPIMGPSLSALERKHGPPPAPGPVIPYGGAAAIASIAAPATISAPPPGPVIDPCLNMVAKSLYDDSTNALDRARSELAAQTLAAERQVFEQARVQEELKRAQTRQEEIQGIAMRREGRLKDAAEAEMARIRTVSEEQLAREREQARIAFVNQQAQLQAAIEANEELGRQLRALAEAKHADAIQHQTQAALLQRRGDELNAALLAQQAAAEEKEAQLRFVQAQAAEAKHQDLINQEQFLKLTEEHRLEREARAKAQREAEENARLRDEARMAAAMAAVKESKEVVPIPGTLPTPAALASAPPPPGPVLFSSGAPPPGPVMKPIGNNAYGINDRPTKGAFTQAGFEKDKKTALHIARIRGKAQIERNRAAALERQRAARVADGKAVDEAPDEKAFVFGPEEPPKRPVYGPVRPPAAAAAAVAAAADAPPPPGPVMESVPSLAGAPAVAAANAELGDAKRQVDRNVPDEGKDYMAARAAAGRRNLDPDLLIARFRSAYPEHAHEPLSVQLAQALGLEGEGRLPELPRRRAAAAVADDDDGFAPDFGEVDELPSAARARRDRAMALFASPEHQARLAEARRLQAALEAAVAAGDAPPPLEPVIGNGYKHPFRDWAGLGPIAAYRPGPGLLGH